MEAILLSLENGESLWPVPVGGTPLGAPLLGRSLLEWNAGALRGAGVTGLTVALLDGAEVPAQHALPMSVCRFPAGTGELEALSACARGLGEDFFVLTGSFLWDGGLRPVVEAHRAGGYALTQVRPQVGGTHPGGTREGTRGRVLPFPAPNRLAAAVCSPAALPALAEGGDWSALPARLHAGALGTAEVQGKCWPVDSPAGLLEATAALLSSKRVPGMGQPLRPGIWSLSPLPGNVELVPPCVIGAGVALGKGCLIGPHAVVEDGAGVGAHSLIQRSILQAGVRVGERATVYGAVVCRRAVLGSGAVFNEGAAVGPDARVGANAALMEGAGVGAGECVPPAVRLTHRVPPADRAPVRTAEEMLALGRRLGRCGLVGAGGAGFRGLLLARTFGCGAAAQGAAVVFHDGVLPEQAAWLAGYYHWPASLFACEDGELYLFDDQGEALKTPPPDEEPNGGSWDLLAGTAAAYAAAVERGSAPAKAAFRSVPVTKDAQFL